MEISEPFRPPVIKSGDWLIPSDAQTIVRGVPLLEPVRTYLVAFGHSSNVCFIAETGVKFSLMYAASIPFRAMPFPSGLCSPKAPIHMKLSEKGLQLDR